jgi:predicted dehydrogenase
LTSESLRIGVVGLGKMGLLHASILNILPGVELAVVCEKSTFTRKLVKKALNGTLVVGDVGEFSGLDLDAVFVTTPTPSHFSVAKAVYQGQIARHVFIEKPLTSRYVQSKELCDLAARNDGVNMVGYLRRFMVTFMKTKELLLQGSIGELVSFNMRAFSSDFFGIHENSMLSMARGGVLRDLGSYTIDLALWLFGNIQLDSAKIDSVTGEGAEDSCHMTVQRKSDALHGSISVSWCEEGYRMPEVDLVINGTKGAIEVNDDRVSLALANEDKSVWYRHDLNDNVKFWLGAPEYYREDAYFLKSARSGSIAEPSFETASKIDLFIDGVQQRAERNE